MDTQAAATDATLVLVDYPHIHSILDKGKSKDKSSYSSTSLRIIEIKS